MASVEEWLSKYEKDIQSAQDNTQDEKQLKECHLAVESLIKAILVKEGTDFRQTHNTPQLAEDIPGFPNEKRKLLSYLFSVYDRRYPDDLDYARSLSAEDAIDEVKDLREWAEKTHL